MTAEQHADEMIRLYTTEPYTLAEIGQRFRAYSFGGYTRERVRQVLRSRGITYADSYARAWRLARREDAARTRARRHG